MHGDCFLYGNKFTAQIINIFNIVMSTQHNLDYFCMYCFSVSFKTLRFAHDIVLNLQKMLRSLVSRVCSTPMARELHTTACLNEVRLLSRLRVVDNSEIGKQAMAEGKPPKIICVYNKKRELRTILSLRSVILQA